ncbi:MAG: YrbL family protein [Verrucomicrobiota bacterium]
MKEGAHLAEQSKSNAELELTNLTPLNKGNSRLVFEHPNDSRWLVKVLRPDLMSTRYGPDAPLRKRRRRYGFYRSFIREIQEYVAVYASMGKTPYFLQTVAGVVETDLGLGLVSKAVLGRNGKLAPSIGTLISSGAFDEAVLHDLEKFLENILACDVVISDMNAGNLVYAYSQEHGNHFVLIDGLGNANFLPFKLLSRQINHRSKRNRFERLKNRIATRLEKAGYVMPTLAGV